MIKINKERCPEDHFCPIVRPCPTKAISQAGVKAPSIDYEKCIECTLCVKYCPYGVFEIG
jgi:Fe-S-cluster-containing hydrogenase component 2